MALTYGNNHPLERADRNGSVSVGERLNTVDICAALSKEIRHGRMNVLEPAGAIRHVGKRVNSFEHVYGIYCRKAHHNFNNE